MSVCCEAGTLQCAEGVIQIFNSTFFPLFFLLILSFTDAGGIGAQCFEEFGACLVHLSFVILR